jgi:FAD/FMN-containing dehydrogenase
VIALVAIETLLMMLLGGREDISLAAITTTAILIVAASVSVSAWQQPLLRLRPLPIRFAKAKKKYLVARSGGHQYSGLSSGGEDTILLSMERFKHLEIETAGGKTVARVGAGMLLTDVAAEFKRHGVTVPHGECPHVAIGGHAQSGGYGHLIRSYGLALDHVVEFKIYTADGALRTVRRPPTQDRSSLFWGVLGGGPGSFGVVTEFTFECVRDTDHRYSWGSGRFYVYEMSLFNAGDERGQRLDGEDRLQGSEASS